MKDERRINRVLSMNVMVGKSRVICQCDHHYTSVPAVYRKTTGLKWNYREKCEECARWNTPVNGTSRLVTSVVVGESLEIVAFYILGLKSKPNSYFLLVTDYFTRLAEAYGILNQQADAVVKQLVQRFICHLAAWSDCTLTKEHSYKVDC
ncbi:hypothetical protein T10_4304 [Trichinella papuae]|uniref:Retrovirus-related Pol polyprotein from transposon n=1 Tax=Trichinella papuae TaxID=268474 RepID=A0A0V1M4Z7_9BILA|nr:hypothetical protein T10_4304 [Trichinella papuae]